MIEPRNRNRRALYATCGWDLSRSPPSSSPTPHSPSGRAGRKIQDIAAKEKAAQAAAQRDAAEKSVEVLGGTEFKIISFYATPGMIQRGDTVDMCYGVSNAKSVKLDPPVANVWPSVDRCMQVTPKKTTTYTFTADDGKGNTKTAQLTIEVR